MYQKKLSLFILFFIITFSSHAQVKEKREKKVDFVPIPYLNYSQSQKMIYGLIPLFTFKTHQKDSISPISSAGASYLRTGRKSWFGNTFAQMYFNEDKWRLAVMLGKGTYHFQTFLEIPEIDPGFYDYASNSVIFNSRLLRKVKNSIFAGVGYFYNKADTKFDDFEGDSIITSNAVQAIVMQDKRDNVYFPTKGSHSLFIYTMYPKGLGNGKNYGIINAYYNKYLKVHDKNVLALRAFAKVGTTNLDFQRQVVLGRVDLRGYTSGKYRGSGKVDIQAEYRLQLPKKFGLVGFAGLGTLFGSNIDDFNGKLYPSLGAGFRYIAVPKTGMRVGVDVARGKDDWAFYFRLGESF